VTVVRKKLDIFGIFYNKDQGAFKQALMGYVTGATNELNSKYMMADGNIILQFYY
jgi:hypothetical protein